MTARVLLDDRETVAEVDAFPTAVEQLVAHRTLCHRLHPDRPWTVSHLPTGAAVAFLATLEEAQRFAELAGAGCSWDFGAWGKPEEHPEAARRAYDTAIEILERERSGAPAA